MKKLFLTGIALVAFSGIANAASLETKKTLCNVNFKKPNPYICYLRKSWTTYNAFSGETTVHAVYNCVWVNN